MLPPPEASETLHAPFACHLWDSRPHPWSDKAFMSPYAPGRSHCEEEFTSMNDIEPGANALVLAALDLAG